MDNKEFNIKTAVDNISLFLAGIASSGTQAAIEGVNNIRSSELGVTGKEHLFCEIVYFYINLVDRFAFHYLDNSTRSEFFRLFILRVYEICWNMLSDSRRIDQALFYKTFNETQRNRQEEYGKYKMESKGEKGHLYYEVASRIAAIFKHGEDEFVIMSIFAVITANIDNLHSVCKKFMLGS